MPQLIEDLIWTWCLVVAQVWQNQLQYWSVSNVVLKADFLYAMFANISLNIKLILGFPLVHVPIGFAWCFLRRGEDQRACRRPMSCQIRWQDQLGVATIGGVLVFFSESACGSFLVRLLHSSYCILAVLPQDCCVRLLLLVSNVAMLIFFWLRSNAMSVMCFLRFPLQLWLCSALLHTSVPIALVLSCRGIMVLVRNAAGMSHMSCPCASLQLCILLDAIVFCCRRLALNKPYNTIVHTM